MIRQHMGLEKREHCLSLGLTDTCIHLTKIMNILLIPTLGKVENYSNVNGVNMFGIIGMEQMSLSPKRCTS